MDRSTPLKLFPMEIPNHGFWGLRLKPSQMLTFLGEGHMLMTWKENVPTQLVLNPRENKSMRWPQELSSEPLMILGTDKQLADVSRFCTSHLDFTYLSVDPTFDFGEFSVAPTSYRNILLKNRNSYKSSVFVGPIFIHHTKKKKTSPQFFAKLKNLAPNVKI